MGHFNSFVKLPNISGWWYTYPSWWNSQLNGKRNNVPVTTNQMGYPLVIKHGNEKSSGNGGFHRNITDKCSIFNCHVWLPEGTSNWGNLHRSVKLYEVRIWCICTMTNYLQSTLEILVVENVIIKFRGAHNVEEYIRSEKKTRFHNSPKQFLPIF